MSKPSHFDRALLSLATIPTIGVYTMPLYRLTIKTDEKIITLAIKPEVKAFQVFVSGKLCLAHYCQQFVQNFYPTWHSVTVANFDYSPIVTINR